MPHDLVGTSKQDLLNQISKSGKVALVDFHATWCGPCKAIAPYVVEQSEKNGITLIKVDVDQAPDVASAYGIQAMPTFKVIDAQGNVFG